MHLHLYRWLDLHCAGCHDYTRLSVAPHWLPNIIWWPLASAEILPANLETTSIFGPGG